MGYFLAGYKFKPTHTDVHFVRDGHGQAGDEYAANFTMEQTEALRFSSAEDAETAIKALMQGFGRDDDYQWTPVIIDLEANRERVILSSRWHP